MSAPRSPMFGKPVIRFVPEEPDDAARKAVGQSSWKMTLNGKEVGVRIVHLHRQGSGPFLLDGQKPAWFWYLVILPGEISVHLTGRDFGAAMQYAIDGFRNSEAFARAPAPSKARAAKGGKTR